MSSCWIRVRENKGGKSWQVLYRRGGRAYRLEAAGTFRTKRDAMIRRDLVSGWLAAGLNPADELARLTTRPPQKLTVREWCARYERSRIDFADETAKNLKSHIRRIDRSLGPRPVDEITTADVQELVADWAAELAPSTVKRYVTTLRLILDHAGVDPNPARTDAIRLPAMVREEPVPPTADQFLRMLDAMPSRYWLLLIVLEQTAMRIGEAQTLAWGDVDEAASRFRLRAARTKGRKSRWVQVPPWLMSIVAATCAREDRTETRRVFPGFSADVAKNAMRRACLTAGMPLFSPHDLRHRRLSLWHNAGVPAKQLAERAGHSRASLTLDVYSHVMPVEEVPDERLERLLVMPR